MLYHYLEQRGYVVEDVRAVLDIQTIRLEERFEDQPLPIWPVLILFDMRWEEGVEA